MLTLGSHCDSYLGHQDICDNRVFGSIHLSVGSLVCTSHLKFCAVIVVLVENAVTTKEFSLYLSYWLEYLYMKCPLVQRAFYVTAQ